MANFFVVSVLLNVVLAAYAIGSCRAECRTFGLFRKAVSRYRLTRRALRESQVQLRDAEARRDDFRATLNHTEQELEKEQEDNERLTLAYTLVLLNVNKRLDIIPPTVAALN